MFHFRPFRDQFPQCLIEHKTTITPTSQLLSINCPTEIKLVDKLRYINILLNEGPKFPTIVIGNVLPLAISMCCLPSYFRTLGYSYF